MNESIEQFIDRQLRSGKYSSRDELEREAFRALQRREAELDVLADHMREAAEEFKQGQVGRPLTLDEVKTAVEKRRAGKTNGAQ